MFFLLVRFGPRFFALNDAYSKKLRTIFQNVAEAKGHSSRVCEGIYTMVKGPNFETPAELRMLKVLGVDAVGKAKHRVTSR